MVNGEQSRSQRLIGLPFTVYFTLCALRLALCALRHGGSPKSGLLGPDFLLSSTLPPRYVSVNCSKGARGHRSQKLYVT